jgi:hypothetical protein
LSDTVFKQVGYDLNSLIKFVELGEIGLPDIQRPFVWPNAKVRDLFDSMYRGYPVGYLLFWQNSLTEPARTIGADDKQKPPRLLIVDGQQRLTSLYAVIQDVPVVREDYSSEHIRIAFNPLNGRFAVSDAAIERDPAFLSDISKLWSKDTDIFEIVDEYLASVGVSRTLTPEEIKAAREAIRRLQALQAFPFTALELSPSVNEEEVAEVFVRINSQGKSLNQSDFILTLMSVFWDEGRSQLEDFCRTSRIPVKSGPSSYNAFIEPDPDQLLRVSVALGFKRARLRSVYSILRGKDMDTEEFSDQLRDEQFRVLMDAQERSLNLTNWHGFLSCVREAGYRSGKMISSDNNLLFSYILYLIGRTEHGIPEKELRHVIAQWFFMSSLTGRFTGSPETRMDFELAQLREASSADEFLGYLKRVCRQTLTDDYWKITLPGGLATSAAISPSLFAFYASLVLLEAPVLFSTQKVADFLVPSGQGERNPIERHHLFPRAHLAKLGITDTRDTNQIANYALIEWTDNLDASGRDPADYMPEFREHFDSKAFTEMCRLHALPTGWEQMEYRDFLERRRELIAGIIRDGYEKLSSNGATDEDERPAAELISDGESDGVELKSTLRMNLHTGKADEKIELASLKTVAGFLNTNGGTLIVGVSDDGEALGLEPDNFASEDKMALHLVSLIRGRLGSGCLTEVHPRFEDHGEHRVLIVDCTPASTPTFVSDGKEKRFYVRTGPSTAELSGTDMQSYISGRF